jgi:two-component SAPR family response regulator
LLEIADRGSFLKNVPYEWLDNIKSDISIQVTDLLLGYMAHADLPRETEFVLRLTHAVFQFDQLNEEALAYKCRCLILTGRHKTAQDAYLKFTKEYRESYGQEYEKSFREVTREG